MKKILSLILTGIMIFSIAGCTASDPGKTPPAESSGEASRQKTAASSIRNSDLFKKMQTVDMDGNKVDKTVFSDAKVTLVNVWNVGCTPCIQELGILDRLNKEYEGKGVAICGLYYGFSADITEEERTEITDIMAAEGAEFPQWIISQDMMDTNIFQEWTSFPGTFLVDSEGNIISKIDGSNDYKGWKNVIDSALKQVSENA